MILPSAEYYLQSIPFADKRVIELTLYIEGLYSKAQAKEINMVRFEELEASAWGLYTWWLKHYNELIDEQEKRTAGTLGHG